MRALTAAQAQLLGPWFADERPGPLVAPHVVATGHGRLLVDRWPAPRAVFAQAGENFQLYGAGEALSISDLRALALDGFLAAPPAFEALVRAAYGDVKVWARVILSLPGWARLAAAGPEVRPLNSDDAARVGGLEADMAWIASTFGGPAGLAASGYAWGAFGGDGALRSVACSFFIGERYEDIGVATASDARGQGLSPACAAALCRDIRARGRTPSWSTTPDNRNSLRVAAKLGFVREREDRLLVINRPIPED
jgi:GNAT superfamily N-acetyltransferase